MCRSSAIGHTSRDDPIDTWRVLATRLLDMPRSRGRIASFARILLAVSTAPPDWTT